MAAGTAVRPRATTRIVRAVQSLAFLVPLTVPVVVVLASPEPGSVKEEIVLDTGQSGPVVGAFGSTRQDATVAVYRRFGLADLPPGARLRLDAGSILVTSPGGIPLEGTVRWSLLTVNPDGTPGAPYGSGEIDVDEVPPPFPDTTALPFGLGPGGIALPPGVSSFFLCVETDNAAVHIGGYTVQGNTLYTSIDGDPPQPVPDADVGATMSGEIVDDGPDPTPTVVATATPVTTVQRVPQAGAGPGANQSRFDTEVTLFNSDGSFDIQVDLAIHPRGGTGWVDIAGFLVPRESVWDIVVSQHVPSDPIFGALDVESRGVVPAKRLDGAAPMAQAVIFAALPDGREFGQFFQAMPLDAAQQAGETSLLFTTHDPVRYRVNVGVTAAADDTRVRLTPLGDGAVQLAPPQNVELDDGGSVQVNDIDRAWGLGNTPNVMVRVEVLAGAAFPYASVLDGRGQVSGTSDPTTILPVTEGTRQVVLLEMGRITGLDEFSGSAMVHNHNAAAATVDVSFHERGVPGVSDSTSITVPGNGVLGWDDAVGNLVGRTGVVGSLVLEVAGNRPGAISAIGREFAIFSANGQITGTAGQLLPGLAPADRLMPGETFHFIGLRDRQTPQGRERSHLGVLNLGDADVGLAAAVYGADGAFEGMVQRTVRAGEQLRVNNVLRAANPSLDDGFKRIEVTADGPLYALAYRVNATGDPVTLRPFRR